MLIAQQKRKQNIAEYLLYLWQVEDMIRACNLDIDQVERNIIDRHNVDEATHRQMREWYEGFIIMMQQEHVEQQGHMQVCKNVLIRLNDLHRLLLAHPDKFADYQADYYRTLPYIVELRAQQPEQNRTDELETCFNALYGVLLLRLQGKPISQATEAAITQIGHFIGLLAAYFRADEEHPLLGDEDDLT